MAAKRHPKQPAPVSFTMDELLMINEVCNGVDFADDELATRLGYPREQLRELLARVSDMIEKAS
jgi:transcription initiation factor IIE alpha subunit